MLVKRFREGCKFLSSLFCFGCKHVNGRDLPFVLGTVAVGVVVTVVVVVTVIFPLYWVRLLLV